MRKVALFSLFTLILFSCSEEKIETAVPDVATEEKTVKVILQNIPEGLEGETVYVFTLTNNDEVYALAAATATEDTIVNILPNPEGSFNIVAYIPTTSNWTTKDPFTSGFYSTKTSITEKDGSYITFTWEEDTSLSGTSRTGISASIQADLTIDTPNPPYKQGTVLSISADIVDNVDGSIKSVTFLLDGTEIETVNEFPYAINWNTKNIAEGEHSFTVVAENQNGDTGKDNVEFEIYTDQNTAPVITIYGISNNAEYERQTIVSINAAISDYDGDVQQVEFKINGAVNYTATTSPFTYSWDTYNSEAGPVEVEVTVIDQSGARRSDFVNVVLVEPENYLPRVSITTPANNTTFKLADTFDISATASDVENDPIAQVAFYINNSYVGAATTEPYTLNYSATTLGKGTHTIVARVYNGNYEYTESQPVEITITD